MCTIHQKLLCALFIRSSCMHCSSEAVMCTVHQKTLYLPEVGCAYQKLCVLEDNGYQKLCVPEVLLTRS
jgi:hypothetical protein